MSEIQRNSMFDLWDRAKPIAHTPAATYLTTRCGNAGVSAHPDFARYLWKAPLRPEWRKGGGCAQAIVTRITDGRGSLMGIHLTYLARGSLPFSQHVGALIGGRIVLGPIGPKLVIADTIERALLAAHVTNLPSVATVVPTNLSNIDLPKGLRFVLIAHHESDPRFIRAARKLGERLRLLRIDWRTISRARTGHL